MVLPVGLDRASFAMANMKVVSLVSHEITRSRAAIMTDLTNVVSSIAQELLAIEAKLAAVQREIETLSARVKQGEGAHPN